MSFLALDDQLGGEVKSALGSVEVQLVFEPPWTPERMSDEAKFLLGVYG